MSTGLAAVMDALYGDDRERMVKNLLRAVDQGDLEEAMRVSKKIINLDRGDGRPIVCAWDTCDRDGTNLYEHVFCEHDPRKGCERADDDLLQIAGRVAHLRFPFCSHRHMQYYVNAEGRNALDSLARTGRAHGNLPVGERTRYG